MALTFDVYPDCARVDPVRVFMVQQVGDWATGDPGAVFDQVAFTLHPDAAARSVATSNGVVGGQLPTAR